MDQALKDHYDQTRKHVQRVQHYMTEFAHELMRRAIVHDETKYGPEEAPLFAAVLPRLNSSTYGSDEYKATLREIKPAIGHHNAANSHHPEHYENGLAGMNLLDLVEMVCDWKAAGERHANGDFLASVRKNMERFGIPETLAMMMMNTEPFLAQAAKGKQ